MKKYLSLAGCIVLLISIFMFGGCNNDDNTPTRPVNQPPVIHNLTSSANTLEWGVSARLTVTAEDPEAMEITYAWTAEYGLFTTATNTRRATWQAPDSTGTFSVSITVSDGTDSTTSSYEINVIDNPRLSVNKNELRLGSIADTIQFRITNTGTGIMDWTAVEALPDTIPDWIVSIDPTSGSCASGVGQDVTVVISRDELTGGVYSGNINISSNAGTKSLSTVVYVAELEITPTHDLDFGTTTDIGIFNMRNAGIGDIRYKITSSDTSWLKVTPDSGQFSSEPVQVHVRVDRTNAPAGLNTGTLTIHSTGGDDVVNARMRVEPVLSILTNSVHFGRNDSFQFSIQNSGLGQLEWEVAEAEDWLTADPQIGTTTPGNPTVVNLNVDRAGLDDGDYQTDIFIDSNGGSHQIVVTLRVGPAIRALGNNYNFGAQSTEMNMILINDGSGSANYQITTDANWITASPSNGSIAAETDTIRLMIDRSGLEGGEHSAIVTVTPSVGTAFNVSATMFVIAPMWIIYDDETFEQTIRYGAVGGWLLMRFTKPAFWPSTRVTRIQLFKSSGGEPFRLEGFDGADPAAEGNFIPPAIAAVALSNQITQADGWATHDVNHTFLSDQFFVGFVSFETTGPAVGVDTSEPHSLRAAHRNANGSTRQYFVDANFGIRIYVEPPANFRNPDGSIPRGMWINANGDEISDPTPDGKYGVEFNGINSIVK